MKYTELPMRLEWLIQLRDRLGEEISNKGFKFEHFECSNARHYLNKIVFPVDSDKYRKLHKETKALEKKDFKRFTLIRLILVDFAILDFKANSLNCSQDPSSKSNTGS